MWAAVPWVHNARSGWDVMPWAGLAAPTDCCWRPDGWGGVGALLPLTAAGSGRVVGGPVVDWVGCSYSSVAGSEQRVDRPAGWALALCAPVAPGSDRRPVALAAVGHDGSPGAAGERLR